MCEAIVGATPRLRRYAHALLAAWPRGDGGDSWPRGGDSWPRGGDSWPRADQDADDLAKKALLDIWRERSAAGHAGEQACDAVLFRRATALARRRFADATAEILDAAGHDSEKAASGESAGHFAWAPEARALPRLPLDLRAILALVVLERLSYSEAGRALGIPQERALARLVVARARLASEISGASRPHLVALAPGAQNQAESDLHRYADDLLDDDRSAEIAAFLETSPEAARRVAEWRRQSERLRRAFAPLMALPLPPSLDFATPETFSHARKRSATPRGVFRRFGALFAAPTEPAAQHSL